VSMSTMELPKFWLLFLYALPTKQSSERVNLWRKLKKLGAVQLKSSAYILPDSPAHFERFQWLAKQVRDSQGDATLIRVSEVEGQTAEHIADLFRKARAADYAELVKEIMAARKRSPGTASIEALYAQFNEIRAIDYFSCPAAHDVEMALRRLD